MASQTAPFSHGVLGGGNSVMSIGSVDDAFISLDLWLLQEISILLLFLLAGLSPCFIGIISSLLQLLRIHANMHMEARSA